MPHLYVKVYMFQMFCALAHIHSLGVCHRDIKPQCVQPQSTRLPAPAARPAPPPR